MKSKPRCTGAGSEVRPPPAPPRRELRLLGGVTAWRGRISGRGARPGPRRPRRGGCRRVDPPVGSPGGRPPRACPRSCRAATPVPGTRTRPTTSGACISSVSRSWQSGVLVHPRPSGCPSGPHQPAVTNGRFDGVRASKTGPRRVASSAGPGGSAGVGSSVLTVSPCVTRANLRHCDHANHFRTRSGTRPSGGPIYGVGARTRDGISLWQRVRLSHQFFQ